MSAPLVSVIMPIYNALPTAHEAIGSILNQSFRNFELLIVDNGSTDGTLEYVRSLSDERIRVLTESNRGAGRATTTAIFASRGEFLAVMDADDVAHPERLQTQVDFLRAHPDVVLVGTRFGFLVDSAVIPVPPQPREHHTIRQALLKGRPVICNPSTMFRAQTAKQIGGHSLAGPGHDLDFFLRMSDAGRVTNIPTLLHYYRLHAASTSIKRMAEFHAYHQFSIACARARANSREEPQIDMFLQQWNQRSRIARLAEFLDRKSLELYRRAIVKRAQKKYISSVIVGIGSALLSPSRSNWHLKRLLGFC